MSNIEWTDRTWNPVVGCTPVSPGCLNCYAATMARRLEGMGRPEYAPREIPAQMGTPYDSWERCKTVRIAEVRAGRGVFTGDVRTVPDRLYEPLSWKKPRRVFVCSMSDLFHESVPFDFIDKVFAVMALTPHITYQVLTKRPERMAEYLNSKASPLDDSRACIVAEVAQFVGGDVTGRIVWDPRGGERSAYFGCTRMPTAEELKRQRAWPGWPLPNVWLGTSAEDQERLDQRVGHLRRCPAAVRFLSLEPLLEPLCFRPKSNTVREMVAALDRGDAHKPVLLDGIHWVIVGGESGPKSRPCSVNAIRGIMAQCAEAGVPVFVKQLGAKPFTDPTILHTLYTPTLGDDFDHHVIKDRKGGDPAEWPDDLNIRQWPARHRVPA